MDTISAHSKHTASMQPAHSQHTASIQPAYSQHTVNPTHTAGSTDSQHIAMCGQHAINTQKLCLLWLLLLWLPGLRALRHRGTQSCQCRLHQTVDEPLPSPSGLCCEGRPAPTPDHHTNPRCGTLLEACQVFLTLDITTSASLRLPTTSALLSLPLPLPLLN